MSGTTRFSGPPSSTCSNGCRSSRSSGRPGSARRSSSSSSRSSSAPSTGRPRLWRGVRDIRVAQPEPFFDPRLPDRAAMDRRAADSIRSVLRKNGFRVREATDADGTRFLYGDRHQYTKLATLLHPPRADPVPRRGGRDVAPRGGAGPGRRRRPDAHRPADRDARPASRPEPRASRRPASTRAANRLHDRPCGLPGRPRDRAQDDPGQRPAVHRAATRSTRTASDRRRTSWSATHQGRPLWDGPVPLTDRRRPALRHPGVPGRDIGLEMQLRRAVRRHDRPADAALPGHRDEPGWQPDPQDFQPIAPAIGETAPASDVGLTVEFQKVGAFTLLIAKNDPGQGLVWIAFVSLIAGITITFYRPRRRVWTRLEPDGAWHRVAVGSLRRRRARVRAAAGRARRGPPTSNRNSLTGLCCTESQPGPLLVSGEAA